MSKTVGPHDPPKWTVEDAGAFQALINGTAQPHQQTRAMKFLIQDICGLNDLSYRPGDPTGTAFAEGKRFVALQIQKLTILNTDAFTKKDG